MNLLTLLDMMAAGHGDRLALGTPADGLTGSELHAGAQAGAARLTASGARTLVYLGENGLGFPLALFAASAAGIPFLPLNYRLAAEAIEAALGVHERPFIIADDPAAIAFGGEVAGLLSVAEWRKLIADSPAVTDRAPPT